MDFNHLWFIKCDTLLFSQPLNFIDLQGMFKNQLQFLTQCSEPGLQQDLYHILQIVDAFFSTERIIQLVKNKQQTYTDNQLLQIEERTTEFRVLIECEKFYANEFWINKKREWVVEVRILACILRIYFFFIKVWELFVGNFVNIKTKMKRYKLILPLALLEPLINDVYAKLQKIQTFYYKHQYPYILEIHLLLKSFKNLLNEFPLITKQDILKDLGLKLIILCQNQKYKSNYVGKFFKIPELQSKKKPKVRPRRLTDIVNEEHKRKSFDVQKTWAKRFSMCIKIQKQSSSVQLVTDSEPKSPISPKLKFRPIVIQMRSKKNTQTSMHRTNSQCDSTRMLSNSRSHFLSKTSFLDEYGNLINSSPRQTMSPTRLPKASPRRMIIQSQIVSQIKQQVPKLLQNNSQEGIKQKQQIYYPILKYHSVQIRENRKRARSWKFKVGEEEIEIIGNQKQHKQQYIQAQIQKILQLNQHHLKQVKQNKYFRDSLHQQQ